MKRILAREVEAGSCRKKAGGRKVLSVKSVIAAAGLCVKTAVVAALVMAMGSCVSMQKYNSQKADVLRLGAEVEALQGRASKLDDDRVRLISDTARLYGENAALRERYADIEERYRRLADAGSAEAARMLKELENSQLAAGSHMRRIEELESMLRSREEAIQSIRRKVADALTGFEGKGLSISVRGGNVYVSMDDKLLFRSGSFEIGTDGARAVRDLAGVLAQNPDINVMVEGHTDDVPYKPNGNLKDNLDLSAKRATTVVRLLLENEGIAPGRVIAAGRGESLPVAAGKTAEARARNRRTEIILTPKLDELMQIMESAN